MNRRFHPLHGLLFDLDGTLVDTAPDMVAALNDLRRAERLDPFPYHRLRNVVSQGAMGLIRHGMPSTDDDQFERWRLRFLELYAERLCQDSVLFGGMEEVLQALESRGLPWGVVTNKPGGLARPLLEALGLASRMVCVVAGDDLEHRKPHPAPLLEACRLAGLPADGVIYVGDAPQDVKAARAAGCAAVVATYGYIPEGGMPSDWGGDALIDEPVALLDLLFSGR